MGAYLSEPVTQKISEDDSHGRLVFGVSGMQGWRMSMEDAHCCLPDIDEKGTAIFGVFDGHGGKEVADYCAENMHRFLMDTEAFQEGDMKKALKDAFMTIDEALTTEEVIKELKRMGGYDPEKEEEEDEAALLLEEANMPLGDLLERLKNSAQEQLDNESGDAKSKGSEEEEEEKEKVSNGLTNHVENGSCNANNPVRSRKQKKPVKRNVEELQTDIVLPNVDRNVPEDQNLAVKGVAVSASADGAGGSSSDGTTSSSSVTGSALYPMISSETFDDEDGLDDEYDPNFGEDDDNDDGDEDDDDEEEDGDDEDEESEDDEDDFEDGEGVDFQAGSDEVGKDSGTTAIVAVLQKNKLYVANVGDSRCVLCRNGKAFELSTDHKPEDTDELNRIEKAGAKVTADGRVNGGLNLSRALGDHLYKQNKALTPEEQAITASPDIKDVELSKDDDFMVLACDGIWNVMTSSEVIQFVKERLDTETEEKVTLSKICEELFDLCLAPDTKNDGSGCDNMTCMIVRFLHTDGTISIEESTAKRTSDSLEENGSSKSKKLKTSQD